MKDKFDPKDQWREYLMECFPLHNAIPVPKSPVVCALPHQDDFMTRQLLELQNPPHWKILVEPPRFITEPTRLGDELGGMIELIPPRFVGSWPDHEGDTLDLKNYNRVSMHRELPKNMRKVGMVLNNIPNPNERILYYGGRQVGKTLAIEQMRKQWPNVGTIGHCDWNSDNPRGFYDHISPLRQAIRAVNLGQR